MLFKIDILLILISLSSPELIALSPALIILTFEMLTLLPEKSIASFKDKLNIESLIIPLLKSISTESPLVFWKILFANKKLDLIIFK